MNPRTQLDYERQLEREKFLAEKRPPHIGYAILMLVFYFGMQLATSFITLFIQLLNGASITELGAAAYWHENVLNTLSFIALLYLCKKLRITFFSKAKIPLKQWLLAGTSFAVMFVASTIVEFIGTKYHLFTETFNEAAIQKMFENSSYFVLFYMVVILAPISEEVVFRGLIMKYLFPKKKLLGFFVASLIFAGVHVPTDFISFLLYWIPALGLGFVYYKTDRLELTIAMHFLNNLISTLLSP